MKNFKTRIITSLEELERSIVEFNMVKDFRSFSELTLEEKRRLETVIGEKITSLQKLRNLIASARVFTFPSRRQRDFWRVRGYTFEESKLQVSQVQRKNTEKKLIKYQVEDFRKFSVRCVEHWVEKGYSIEDAKKEVGKRQATNSIESLTRRYGEERAREIRDEITRKWQASLNSKSIQEKERINGAKGNCKYKLQGKKKSEEHRRNISKSKIGKAPHNKGKTWEESYPPEVVQRLRASNSSPERRRNLRRARIKQIEERYGTVFPNYNKDSIPIIEDFGRKNGYTFQHAENGGEYRIEGLGYWLDAYDEKQNVVLEIDESHHFTKSGELRKRDQQRQREIEQTLGCKFIRIKYEKHKN